MQLFVSRDAQFGAQTGAAFAEGFIVVEPLRVPHLFAAAGVEWRAHAESAS
jgi:hypothetical protein